MGFPLDTNEICGFVAHCTNVGYLVALAAQVRARLLEIAPPQVRAAMSVPERENVEKVIADRKAALIGNILAQQAAQKKADAEPAPTPEPVPEPVLDADELAALEYEQSQRSQVQEQTPVPVPAAAVLPDCILIDDGEVL